MNLEKELSELQDALAMVDLFTPMRSIDPDSMASESWQPPA
jgi:hypothetical protein